MPGFNPWDGGFAGEKAMGSGCGFFRFCGRRLGGVSDDGL